MAGWNPLVNPYRNVVVAVHELDWMLFSVTDAADTVMFCAGKLAGIANCTSSRATSVPGPKPYPTRISDADQYDVLAPAPDSTYESELPPLASFQEYTGSTATGNCRPGAVNQPCPTPT